MQIRPRCIGRDNNDALIRSQKFLDRTRQCWTSSDNNLTDSCDNIRTRTQSLLEGNEDFTAHTGNHGLGKNWNPRALSPAQHRVLCAVTSNHNRCKIRLDHALRTRFTHNLGGVDLDSPAAIFPKLRACRGLGLVAGSKRITESAVDVDWPRSAGGMTSGSCKSTRNTARNTSQFSAIRRKIPFFHDVVGKNSLLRHGLRCANAMQFSGTIRTNSHKRKTRIKRLADRGVQMRHRTSRGRNDAGARSWGTAPFP